MEMPDAKYFSWFSNDNDFYVYCPVQKNFDIVKSLTNLFKKDLSEKDSHNFLSRTYALYLSAGNLSNQNKTFQMIASGNYPVLFLKMALKPKRGWHKTNGYYSHTSGIKLKIINSSAIMLSNSDINKISETNNNSFTMKLSDKISFFLKNPNSVISKLFGKIQFPVSDFWGTISGYKDNNYNIDADFKFTEPKALKPAQVLLKLAGLEAYVNSNLQNTLSISGFSINVKRMEELWTQK
jgi:hypothetical protein